MVMVRIDLRLKLRTNFFVEFVNDHQKQKIHKSFIVDGHNMAFHKTLDPRARPPSIIQETYKQLQKLWKPSGEPDAPILDLRDECVRAVGFLSRETILQACLAIEEHPLDELSKRALYESIAECKVYEHVELPGR